MTPQSKFRIVKEGFMYDLTKPERKSLALKYYG